MSGEVEMYMVHAAAFWDSLGHFVTVLFGLRVLGVGRDDREGLCRDAGHLQ